MAGTSNLGVLPTPLSLDTRRPLPKSATAAWRCQRHADAQLAHAIARPARIPGTRSRSQTKRAILIADDEPTVGAFLQVLFQRLGFAVWLAQDGRQACDFYRRHGAEIALVLLDVRMPGLNGPETLAALQAINPAVSCCFISGDTGAYSHEELLQRGAVRVLAKPFGLADLMGTLGQVASQPG